MSEISEMSEIFTHHGFAEQSDELVDILLEQCHLFVNGLQGVTLDGLLRTFLRLYYFTSFLSYFIPFFAILLNHCMITRQKILPHWQR